MVGCYTHNITWNEGGTSDFYSIDYSTDNGATWTGITSFYNTTGGSYNWNIPDQISSANCLIKVTDSNNGTTLDSSDAVFTISTNADIIITATNG